MLFITRSLRLFSKFPLIVNQEINVAETDYNEDKVSVKSIRYM